MSMIQVQEARDQILSKIKVKGVEKVSLDQALGRVLAEDIVAGLNNPPLDNSAMDGYALIAEDIAAATPESPVKLEVVGEIAAGYSAKGTLKSRQAMRIMTGAPILPLTTFGKTEASTTLSELIPFTRISESTTLLTSVPIAHVPH